MPQVTEINEVPDIEKIGLIKADLSGAIHTDTLNSAGDWATGSERLPFVLNYPNNQKLYNKKSNINTKIRLIFNSCIAAVDEAIENYSDFILRENAIDDLRQGLLRLWDIRNEREKYFSNFINTLNIILLRDEDDELTINHLNGIRRVLNEALLLQHITKADIRDTQKILQLAGCDVYKGLR